MADVPIPLGVDAWKRDYAGEPEVKLLNRFFERNPSNLKTGASLLARPGSTYLTGVGSLPHRGKFTKPGFMDGDLFVVSENTLYRYQADGTLITIAGEILNDGDVSFAAATGPGYQHLFLVDGLLLQVYTGGSYATATLTDSGSITNQVVEIGGTYYSWGNEAAMAAAADGSSSTPWLALLGGDDAESLINLEKLINFSGVRGVDYSSTLGGPSTLVTALADDDELVITSKDSSSDANDISTTIFSGSDLAWGGTEMSGGGVHAMSGVAIPAGEGALAVAPIDGYVLVAQTNSDVIWWVRPGELTIDALDFATAESQPDKVLDLVSVGDTVWVMGESSCEVWYSTGDSVSPFAPIQGRTWQRGVIAGTAVQVKDSAVVVGDDNVVYAVGGQPQRISHHGIEERIRKQLTRELTQ